jgi:hypothetical protein
VRDPVEGVDRAGSIVTGVGFDRVPAPFGPVIDAAVDAVNAYGDASSLYVYGSVASGDGIGLASPPAESPDPLHPSLTA